MRAAVRRLPGPVVIVAHSVGGEVAVPTMEGSAKMKLPAGSQPGARFRLKGRGLPKSGGARGDLYVILSAVIPKTLTPKQQELWQALAQAG